jgi:hypothetical protein
MAQAYGVNAFVESGTAQGRSATIVAESLHPIPVTTIDWEPQSDVFDRLNGLGITTIRGDASKVLVPLLAECNSKRIGVFIDGPKGADAVDLAAECMENSRVRFVGVHDLSKITNRKERELFDALDYPKWYTDDAWFVEAYKHLDARDQNHWDEEQGTKWQPYKRLDRRNGEVIESDRGSYGYTIGFLYKEGAKCD